VNVSAFLASPRWQLFAALLVALTFQLGVALRQGLWSDEIFSLAIATGHSLEHPARVADASQGDFVQPPGVTTAGELRRYLAADSPPADLGRVLRAVLLSDTSPPLYYVLLNIWTRFAGASDTALRVFSMVFALACLPLLSSIARRTDASGAWSVPVLLFAVAPLSVYYATEGRMYALFWFLVCALVWLTLRLQEPARNAFTSTAWVVTAAAGLLTHYFFVFPLSAAVLFLLLQPGAGTRGRILIHALIAGVLVAPWYWHVPASLGAWRITGGWLNDPPGGYSRWSAWRELGLQFFSSRNLGLWFTPNFAWLLATLVLGVVALVALWRAKHRLFTGPRLLVWLWFAAPLAGVLLFDALRGTYVSTNARYASAALPAACLLAGLWLSTLRPRWQLVCLGLVAFGWGWALRNIHQTRWRNGLPFREVARTVSARAATDDLVIVHAIPSGVLGFSRYARPDLPVAAWVQQLGTRREADTAGLVRGRSHVFLVKMHDLGAAAPEEDWLRAHAEVVVTRQLGHATWTEFVPRSGAIFTAP
jgi:hypothetical protein